MKDHIDEVQKLVEFARHETTLAYQKPMGNSPDLTLTFAMAQIHATLALRQAHQQS